MADQQEGGGEQQAPKEEKKGPSKKELKKAAKKAKKAESQPAPPDAAPSSSSSAVDAKPTYYLAHASDDCGATLKACVASAAFGVPLVRAPPSAGGLDPFLHGPALLLDPKAGATGAVAFGGNGAAKALSLLAAVEAPAPGEAGMGKDLTASEVDDVLEFERTALRPALNGGNAKKVDRALAELEGKLSARGHAVLVGECLTAADVCVCVTLSRADGLDLSKYPAVKKYLEVQTSGDAFVKGKECVATLVPPPPFDYANDPSLLRAVESVFAAALERAFPQSAGLGVPPSVMKCNQLKHGDYQCNASMPLFQKLKKGGGALPAGIGSPQDVARAIIAAIPEDNPAVDSLEVNGPGFVLCRVRADYLQGHMNALVRSGAPPPPKSSKKETVVVDFSSPNIAKEMHVGHLRSTIIGESVCRVLEYVGCDVKRVNHVGDWGTQFGMLIQYLKENFPDFHKDHGGAESSISDLTVFYKNAKKRFDEEEEFKEASRINVVKLQSGDEECREIWQILCDVSRREFVKVYDRLDITVEECGESFYNDKIPPVIEEFDSKSLIDVQDGGAKCVFVPNFRVPLMLQKSDGGFGYDSTDMAALRYRLHDLGATRLVYITDFGQGDHFKMCFAAAREIGWIDPSKQRLMHIGFGTVMGEDGKRFKTRSGDTVRLVDLLDEAVGRMETSLRDRIKDGSANIEEGEVHETACAMGYGAVKYFDLRRNPTTNYKFSYDQMLDTKGNTAIYLLYAHARLESICSKGKAQHSVDVDELIKNGTAEIAVGHPSERNLAMHLRMFADVVEETLDDLFPYHICDYLYAVSIAVSDFVTQCRVLGSPEMESRLLLCRATAIVMRQCFDLLAIRHVMRI